MIREDRPIKKLIIAMGMVLILLFSGPITIVSANQSATTDVTIKVNGELLKMTDSIFIVKGRMFVPVAPIASAFGAKLSWDNANDELTLHTALNEKIVFGDGVPVIYFNEERYRLEATPFMDHGRLYAPIRQLAELLHVSFYFDAASNGVELQSVQTEIATAEYALTDNRKLKADISSSVLSEKVEPFSDADLMLLAKITMVEAGYEGYQGQLALANVILNRVKDSRFPDTIREVIYSGKQFPPAHNGLLDKSKPNKSVLRAAKDALNGKNNIGNAIYFFNPKVSKGSFWSSLDVIDTIGHHTFAR